MDDNRVLPSTNSVLTISGYLLLALFLLNGLGGVAGGIAVIKEVLFPDVWLQGTPFHSYFLPGLILCVVVGGIHLVAAYVLLKGLSSVKTVSLVAGLVLTGWMISELLLIGFRAPIQVWFVGIALVEVALSFTKLRRA